MDYIVKFGGSLLFHSTTLDIDLSKVKLLIDIISSSGNVHGLVCGGGKIARIYIQAGRSLGFDEETLDKFGILVSRINAQFLINALGDSVHPKPIENVNEARQAKQQYQFFVAGGFKPKQSTTTVAMQLCEELRSNLVILTDVDGIYNKDPKKYPDAVKYDQISIDQIESLLLSRSGQEQTAGKYQIFDLLSLSILKRSGIKVRIIDGTNLENLRNLLTNNFDTINIGTIISS